MTEVYYHKPLRCTVEEPYIDFWMTRVLYFYFRVEVSLFVSLTVLLKRTQLTKVVINRNQVPLYCDFLFYTPRTNHFSGTPSKIPIVGVKVETC